MTTKPVKLTTEAAIDAAKDLDQTRKQMNKDFALLQLRQSREITDLTNDYKKRFRDLFRIATADILPDPDEAFSANSHYIDTRFLEFGDAYLIPVPQENGPQIEADETTGESTPARIIIN